MSDGLRCACTSLPIPTIAAVNGVAAGAGCNLALGCDLIVASDHARFTEIFAKRGLAFDFGGSWVLPRLVGLHQAKELAFLAEIVDAQEAERIGIVNRVVPHAELAKEVDELATRIAAMPPLQLAMIKRQLNDGLNRTMAEAIEYEGVVQALMATSHDTAEAMIAFLQKRDPRGSPGSDGGFRSASPGRARAPRAPRPRGTPIRAAHRAGQQHGSTRPRLHHEVAVVVGTVVELHGLSSAGCARS